MTRSRTPLKLALVKTDKPLDPQAAVAHAEELRRIGVLSPAALAGVKARVRRMFGSADGSGLKSTVSTRGTTTVPAAIREALALEDGGEIEWAPGDGFVVVRRAQLR